jgi:hypothetical protein
MKKMKKINIRVKVLKEMKMKKKKKKKKKILLLIFTISQRKEDSRLMPEDHKSNKKWL